MPVSRFPYPVWVSEHPFGTPGLNRLVEGLTSYTNGIQGMALIYPGLFGEEFDDFDAVPVVFEVEEGVPFPIPTYRGTKGNSMVNLDQKGMVTYMGAYTRSAAALFEEVPYNCFICERLGLAYYGVHQLRLPMHVLVGDEELDFIEARDNIRLLLNDGLKKRTRVWCRNDQARRRLSELFPSFEPEKDFLPESSSIHDILDRLVPAFGFENPDLAE